MSLFSIFKRKTSSQIAKDRLKILLISDRVNCSPEMMELIKNDIAQVISKYMKIDTKSMEIQITKTGNKQLLAGDSMRYDLTVSNTSNVALDNFFWHDRFPTDCATAKSITTGTCGWSSARCPPASLL